MKAARRTATPRTSSIHRSHPRRRRRRSTSPRRSSARRGRPTGASSRSRPPSTSTRRCGRRSARRRDSAAPTRRPSPTRTCRRSPRTAVPSRPASASASADRRRRSKRRRSAARPRSARSSCWAPPSRGSRSCPVVLDPTVAASFVGFIGGVLCADAVQRGRSPFADRLGEEIASSALALADDGTRSGGDGVVTRSTPRACQRARTASDRGRAPLLLPARLLHGAP